MQYRPAHGNDYPADIQRQAQHATLRISLEGKTKGAPRRHDIHLSILINLHNGDILWKIMRIDGIGGIPKIGKFQTKKFQKVGGKKKSINIFRSTDFARKHISEQKERTFFFMLFLLLKPIFDPNPQSRFLDLI